jgi:protein-L-isoaspartate(D-aspartate) O-methyltransferase
MNNLSEIQQKINVFVLLPGKEATISCPHSYPLFYEPLGRDRGHQFLEVGLGSGYGAAVAREVVGPEGLVIFIEIDPLTFEFERKNPEDRRYHDIVLVNDDGSLGYPANSPYERISIAAEGVQVMEVVLTLQVKKGF